MRKNKSHRPNIQGIFEEYVESWNKEQEKISFEERMIEAQKLFMKMQPFLIMAYAQSGISMAVLRKNKHHKRSNRNL